MSEKVGRNDPCPCGSGKKYKQCCIKHATTKKKIKAVVIKGGGVKPGEPRQMPDLLERTFGETIAKLKTQPAEKAPEPASEEENQGKS